MDAEQLRELRRWADGLATVDQPELRAAAKAIVMLADEVEALRARLAQGGATVERAPEPETVAAPKERREGAAGELGSVLRARLRSFAHGRLAEPGGNSPSEPPADRQH